MSLRRLELRFGTKGGFLGEPDVRRYRYGPKLTSGSADAIRRLRLIWIIVLFMLARIRKLKSSKVVLFSI